MRHAILILLLLTAAFTSRAQQKSGNNRDNYLVVLSMDGFRWDYPDSFPVPNLQKMARKGVKAKSLIPSFPSVTFPNHYTMATGLYPDHHGLVNNSFYDSVLNAPYRISDRKAVENGLFYAGEPIWNTAEKQGVKTAIFYWVGSEADIQEMHPTIWKKYDEKVTYEARIDSVIHWLSLPESNRPRLIMFYFDEPDHVGHSFGPFSPQTRATVMRVDSLAGLFMRKLKNLPIARQVNFIVTSDHGMGSIDDSRKILLYEHIRKSWVKRLNGYNPIITLEPRAGCLDSIYLALKNLAHISIWKKHEVPASLHWGTNPRIDQLVVLADSGWSIAMDPRPVGNGAHGYDPSNTDMHAIFYAKGPAFKKGYTIPSFRNIQLYSLMAQILGITPAGTDKNPDFSKAFFLKR